MEYEVVTNKEIEEKEIIDKIAVALYKYAKSKAEEELTVSEAISFNYHYDPEAPEDERNKGVTLAPGEEIVVTEEVSVTGKIYAILVHVPPGTAGLVKFRLLLDNQQIFPRSGYFSADSFDFVLNVSVPVRKGQKLTLHAINRGSKSHFLHVEVLAQGYK